MANQVARGRTRSGRKRQHRVRRRVEHVALTQTTRCGAPKPGGLRSLFRIGLLVALLLAPILFAAGTLAGTVTLDPPPDSAYWTRHSTQAGGNPLHSGQSSIDLTDGQLTVQWRRDDFQPFLAGAVMDRENVYVVDRNGTVAALNLTAGTTMWTFDAAATVTATPALAYGWLYVATEDKELIALSARTGTEIVRATLSGIARAPPTVAEGRVFQGNDAGQLQVFDATTLDELWTFDTNTKTMANGKANETDATLNKPIRAAPAVYDGKVYVAAWNKRVYAFSVTGNNHGSPENWYWTRTVGDIVTAAPSVDRHRDRLLVGTAGGQIDALKLSDGALAWRVDAGGSIHRGLAVAQDRLVAATSDGRLMGIDPYGGAVQWQRVDEPGYIAAPVLTHSAVAALTANGTLHLFAPKSGDTLKADGTPLAWRLSSGSHATPAVTDRGITLVDQSGSVVLVGPPVARQADLVAGALVPPENLTADTSLVVTARVTNNGPHPSGTVTLTWTLDDGSSGTTTIDGIASGATASNDLVLPPLAPGTHILTVTYTGDADDATPADATTATTLTIVGTGDTSEGSGAPSGADQASDTTTTDTTAEESSDGFLDGFGGAFTAWMLPVSLLSAAGGVAGMRNRDRIMTLVTRIIPRRAAE